MSVSYCGSSFCDPQKPSIDIACHDLGKEAGKWIMYQVGGKTCYCICSCLGQGTLVTTGDNKQIRVEDIIGNATKVLAAGKDLVFKPTTVQQIVGTNPGKTDNSIYLSYRLNGVKVERVVTMDHPFLLRDKTLVGAGVLQLDDQLLDQQGNPVNIDSLRWGSYIGRFWEFATSVTEPDQQLDGHLVLTDGVVTGDYAVTVFVNYPVNKEEMRAGPYAERPLVGTAAWLQRNKIVRAELDPGIIELEDGAFIPAEAFAQTIPDHAAPFLPTGQAALLELRAPMEPVSNQYFLEMCEYLIQLVFEPAYPDINFLFNWYDDRTNAASWIDGITGEPYVYLSGALARIKGFDIEGVTLALAHEVGHIIGRPRLENGVTCEGQADWFGGSVVLRTLWFGEAYFSNVDKAISQFELLYRYMRKKGAQDVGVEGPEVDDTGQPYPSNACRIETYRTAMTSPTAPACSLCAVPEGEDLDIADGEDQFAEGEGAEDLGGQLAKVAGARDRQRRKKRTEADDGLDIADGEDQFAEGEGAEDLGGQLAKVAGARDRQRRKKRTLADQGLDIADEDDRVAEDDDAEDEGGPLAKVAGARDRQRRKARSLGSEDPRGPLAKVAGARDRQRRKARSLGTEDSDAPLAKVAGARDRQRRKASLTADYEDLGSMAKIAGARDRAKKKKFRKTQESGGSD